MPSYLTSIVLQFSEDPISDTTPTWTDVTAYMREIAWQVGVDREGSDPQPGSMTVVMRNTNRDWEPDYVAGRFYPNVTTQRRFRLTLNGVQQGVWYVQSFDIAYPLDTDVSLVTVTCGDGFEILSLDDLPGLDPPDADSYEDVVSFDEPWGYWRLGEPEGTKLVSHLRVTRKRVGSGKKRRKIKRRWKTRETRAEVSGVAGPSGTYKNTPTLGVDGLVLGDQDAAVEFGATEYARVPLEDDDLNGKAFTLEALVKPDSAPNDGDVIRGPAGVTSGVIWNMFQSSGSAAWGAQFIPADLGVVQVFGGTPAAGVGAHLAATWDGHTLKLYVDGVLVDSESSAEDLQAIAANPFLTISHPTGGLTFEGVLDEVAVYEHALTAERIAAHYTAATARGFPFQTAGLRIEEIVDHPLWNTSSIQLTGRDLQPAMKAGQAKLEEVAEAAHAEGPRTLFFFDGAGNPVYLGHEFQATSANYNTPMWTFGDVAGEVSYQDIGLEYDNETFNDVTANKEGGELVNVTDTAAIDDKGRRANSEWTDVTLSEDADVTHLANDVLAFYKDPALRPVTLTVNGAKALTQILNLDPGHMVRVKRRGEGGTPIDRVCHILGAQVSVDENEHMVCTYRLSRGFNAALGDWQLGIDGFSELGQTAVLA